jgi:hypothetical protein
MQKNNLIVKKRRFNSCLEQRNKTLPEIEIYYHEVQQSEYLKVAVTIQNDKKNYRW